MSPVFSSRMIPRGWAAHHQPATNTSHNGTATIRKEDTPTHDLVNDVSGRILGETVYTNVAVRVQRQRTNSGDVDQGEQLERITTYMVAMAPEYIVERGDVIAITSSDDPLLKELQIVYVLTGTERFERNVLCEENPHSNLEVLPQ